MKTASFLSSCADCEKLTIQMEENREIGKEKRLIGRLINLIIFRCILGTQLSGDKSEVDDSLRVRGNFEIIKSACYNRLIKLACRNEHTYFLKSESKSCALIYRLYPLYQARSSNLSLSLFVSDIANVRGISRLIVIKFRSENKLRQ